MGPKELPAGAVILMEIGKLVAPIGSAGRPPDVAMPMKTIKFVTPTVFGGPPPNGAVAVR